MAITSERAKSIIKLIYSGKQLKEAMPNPSEMQDFYEYIGMNAEAGLAYARAQQVRGELLADEVVDISDNEVDAQRARNRIDARKWYASKMQPQKYGDRIDLNVNQTVDIGTALLEASQRALRPRRDPAIEVESEVVDIKQVTDSSASGCESVAPTQDPFS